jgi:putative addiction module CopG family antidote
VYSAADEPFQLVTTTDDHRVAGGARRGTVDCLQNGDLPYQSLIQREGDHPVARRRISISFDDQMLSFAQHKVATGRYSSTSDVVRAGLRLLEEHESRVHALRETDGACEWLVAVCKVPARAARMVRARALIG